MNSLFICAELSASHGQSLKAALDLVDAAKEAGASAVAAGALFQFSDCVPKEAARYLHEHNIESRMTS